DVETHRAPDEPAQVQEEKEPLDVVKADAEDPADRAEDRRKMARKALGGAGAAELAERGVFEGCGRGGEPRLALGAACSVGDMVGGGRVPEANALRRTRERRMRRRDQRERRVAGLIEALAQRSGERLGSVELTEVVR